MKINKFLIPITLIAGLLLAGCGATTAPTYAVPEGAQAGQLDGLQPCEFQPQGRKAKFAADCGTLIVPENWDKAESRLIPLPVVRVPASGPNPAEPVFWLVGGPGGTNLSWAPPAWLLAKHDVVQVGYRGVDGSVVLACPELGRAFDAHTGWDLESEQARAEYQAGAKKCATDLQAQGVDLSGYAMPNVIQDMEAARTALGYKQINLFSESYGTRLAELYAYMHPDSLHRVILIGVNTPGHFIWSPSTIDEQIQYLSALCSRDAACSSRTPDLARTIYTVNRTMPKHWLFFNIDPATVRLGTQFMLFDKENITTIMDTYLAAGEGDPSGLAMDNLTMQSIKPLGHSVLGDYLNKGGTADLERYGGLSSVSLGDSIMGAPFSELIWPLATVWPVPLIPKELREFQQTDVDMLLINGTVDFSTPPVALDEARPYFHKAQFVLLPEFSHVGDEYTLQQQAFERLITSYYDTGRADSSLYVYDPLSFKPGMSMTVLAKLLAAAMIVVPVLIILAVAWVVRGIQRRRTRKST